MKYCEHCGHPLEDTDRFCENCGQTQTDDAAPVSMAGPMVAPKKSKAPLIIGLVSAGVVTIIAIFVGALWYLGYIGSDSTDTHKDADSISLADPQFPETPEITTTTAPTEATTTTMPPVVVPGDASGVEVFPEGEPHAGYSYRVKAGGGLYMRSGPSQAYSQLQLIPDGATVVAYYTQGEWWYGSYNGILGWMNSSYLIVVTEYAETPVYYDDYSYYSYEYNGYYRVTSNNGVNMRSGPGTEFRVVIAMPYYADIEVHRRSGNWVYGYWNNGGNVYSGWVRIDNLIAIPE